jgi:hypothetical protein
MSNTITDPYNPYDRGGIGGDAPRNPPIDDNGTYPWDVKGQRTQGSSRIPIDELGTIYGRFNSSSYASGLSYRDKYAPRDAKTDGGVRLSSSHDFIMNRIFDGYNLIRARSIFNPKKETAVEQEALGLRLLWSLSSGYLYNPLHVQIGNYSFNGNAQRLLDNVGPATISVARDAVRRSIAQVPNIFNRPQSFSEFIKNSYRSNVDNLRTVVSPLKSVKSKSQLWDQYSDDTNRILNISRGISDTDSSLGISFGNRYRPKNTYAMAREFDEGDMGRPNELPSDLENSPLLQGVVDRYLSDKSFSILNIPFVYGNSPALKYEYNTTTGNRRTDSIETLLGIGSKFDTINSRFLINADELQDDLVPLIFTSVRDNKSVQFRSTVTRFSENINATWNANRFMGSPFNHYNYSMVERTIGISFTVFAYSQQDLDVIWLKYEFLTSLAYPKYVPAANDAYHTPPLIKFTFGDLYKNRPAIIDSIATSIEATMPWSTDPGRKLPQIFDVDVQIKLLEDRYTTIKGTNSRPSDPDVILTQMYDFAASGVLPNDSSL